MCIVLQQNGKLEIPDKLKKAPEKVSNKRKSDDGSLINGMLLFVNV
jgi:hypothetical protein